MAAPELRAVLDTNVVVSAALKPHSLPAAIVSAANASHLVTGNTRHFPHQFRTIRVVTPREFFALLLERLDQ